MEPKLFKKKIVFEFPCLSRVDLIDKIKYFLFEKYISKYNNIVITLAQGIH